MSKTDKDRPFWVQNLDIGRIDHDHRTGVCIIGDDKRESWSSWRNHRRVCKKNVTVEYTCTKQDPVLVYRWREGRVQTCWGYSRVCPCPIPDDWKNEDHGCTGRYRYTQCVGHTRIEHDASIPCACDDRPPRATCFPAWNFGYCYGGVPHEFVRTYYHGPERARERQLKNMAREYNTYGDIEDDDFFNRQARSSARWDYW